MKISFVVASFQSLSGIKISLDSILSQTYENFEIIIVYRRCSSDDISLPIIEEYISKDHRLKLILDDTPGIYYAWNIALDKIKGDWVIFLGDTDKFTSKYKLESLVNLLNQNRNLNFLSSRAFRSGKIIGEKLCINKIWIRPRFIHAGALHSKSLFEHRKFNKSYKISGDYEFLIRSRFDLIPGFTEDVAFELEPSGISQSKPFLTLVELLKALMSNGYNIFSLIYPSMTLGSFFKRRIFNM